MMFDWMYQSEIGQQRLEEYFNEEISSIFKKHSSDDSLFMENKYVLLYFCSQKIGDDICVRFLLDYNEENLVNAYKKLLQKNFGSISLYYYIDKIIKNRLSLSDHTLSKEKKWPKNPPPLPPLLVNQFEDNIHEKEDEEEEEEEEESYGYVSVIGESAHSQSNISSFDDDSTDSTSSDTI